MPAAINLGNARDIDSEMPELVPFDIHIENVHIHDFETGVNLGNRSIYGRNIRFSQVDRAITADGSPRIDLDNIRAHRNNKKNKR